MKERLDAVREKITKENNRLIDARNDKLEAAKKKAAELNARFAEWYYEISDADYKRLRVSLEDLIQKKGAANANTPPDFNGFNPGAGNPLPFNLPSDSNSKSQWSYYSVAIWRCPESIQGRLAIAESPLSQGQHGTAEAQSVLACPLTEKQKRFAVNASAGKRIPKLNLVSPFVNRIGELDPSIFF